MGSYEKYSDEEQLSPERLSKRNLTMLSSDDESSTDGDSRKKRGQKRSIGSSRRDLSPPRKGFVREVVYEEPTDALIPAPFRRTRPKTTGEIVADILFFGDSLSLGITNHDDHSRSEPWPFHLKDPLAMKGFNLVTSSFPGRLTCFNNDWNDYVMEGVYDPTDFNGLFHFGTYFSSHSPNWVVVMLGTFDTQVKARRLYKSGVCTANQVAEHCVRIADKAREMFDGHCHEGNLKIALVSPPPIKCTEASKAMGFDSTSCNISKMFPQAFERVCIENDLVFIDSGLDEDDLASDGVHLTAEGAQRLADAVWSGMQRELPRRSKKPERFDPLRLK